MNIRNLACAMSVACATLALAGCGGGGGGGGTPSTLVSYWPANGNYNDVVGGNDGTPVGGVSFATGESGQAFDFDGQTGRIFVPDSTSLAFTQSMAITCWIKVAAYPSDRSMIFFRGDDRGYYDPYFFCINSQGQLEYTVSDQFNDISNLIGTSITVPLNTWTYVSCSIDNATGVQSIYVNGSLAGTQTTTIRPFATLDPNANPGEGIGTVQSSNYSFYFNGLIDELKTYSSAAPAAAPPSP